MKKEIIEIEKKFDDESFSYFVNQYSHPSKNFMKTTDAYFVNQVNRLKEKVKITANKIFIQTLEDVIKKYNNYVDDKNKENIDNPEETNIEENDKIHIIIPELSYVEEDIKELISKAISDIEELYKTDYEKEVTELIEKNNVARIVSDMDEDSEFEQITDNSDNYARIDEDSEFEQITDNSDNSEPTTDSSLEKQ